MQPVGAEEVPAAKLSTSCSPGCSALIRGSTERWKKETVFPPPTSATLAFLRGTRGVWE